MNRGRMRNHLNLLFKEKRMKRISTLMIVLAALFAGGCEGMDLFARLGNIPDHIRLVRTDAGFLGVALVLEDNPFDALPLLN